MEARRSASVAVVGGVTAAIVGVFGAAAWAAVQYIGADGSLSACASDRDGQLRLLEPGETCRSGETPVSWAQQGPVGPAGPVGPQGATGPQGVPGLSGLVVQPVPVTFASGPDGKVQPAVFTGLCPSGKRVLSGGFDVRNLRVERSTPTADGTGWSFTFVPTGKETPSATAAITCASVAGSTGGSGTTPGTGVSPTP